MTILSALNPITAVVDAVSSIVGDLAPDSKQKLAAKLDAELKQRGLDLEAAKLADRAAERQVELNKAEAASASPMARTWRPALGWLCVIVLGYHYLGHPLLSWLWAAVLPDAEVPGNIDMGDLIVLLTGMLGLGGARTLEKLKGVKAR